MRLAIRSFRPFRGQRFFSWLERWHLHLRPFIWFKRLTGSKVWIVVRLVLSLVLMASLGCGAGVLAWAATRGLVEAKISLPHALVAATTGVAVSVAGCGLLVLMHFLLAQRLFDVEAYLYERWIGYIAPVIGGVVGVTTRTELVSGGIPIVGLSALIGGAVAPIVEFLTGGDRAGAGRNLIPLLAVGAFYGAINGVVLALAFAVLKAMGWA